MMLAAVFLGFFTSVKSTFAVAPFVTTWKTDNPGTSDPNQITIPTREGGYDYDVDWGDSSSDNGVTGDITHTYLEPGNYTVTITGDFPRIWFDDGGDRQKILSVEQWGSQVWSSMNNAFFGCSNMVINAVDSPDLSSATDMTYMLRESGVTTEDLSSWDVSHVQTMIGIFQETSFNGNISIWDTSAATNMVGLFYNDPAFNGNIDNWDTSHVTTMAGMFVETTSFNQPLNAWDVSAVSNMNEMFRQAISFNQPLNAWDVSSVTDMADMFNGAGSFDQDISSWNVSSVTTMNAMFLSALSFNQPLNAWDVSSVTTMVSMFATATSFNQPLNAWDVSSTIDMNSMFNTATSFNQDLSSWNVTNVTNMNTIFFQVPLSLINYDTLLMAWSQEDLQPDVLFGAGDNIYCLAAEERASMVSDFDWTITDGGLDCTGVHSVSYHADIHGSIVGEALQRVYDGHNGVQVSAVPVSGYHFVDWSDASTLNPRIDSNVTGDISVIANFSVTQNTGGGGYSPVVQESGSSAKKADTIKPAAPEFEFRDVPRKTHKNASAIYYLNDKGIIQGYEDQTFRPKKSLTRGELITILVKAVGVSPDGGKYKDCFPDVNGQKYAPYVCYAKEAGWVGGYQAGEFKGLYKPSLSVSKAEAMKMLLNAFEVRVSKRITLKPFTDVSVDAWYAPFIAKAKELSLPEDTGSSFHPAFAISRGALSESLYRLMGAVQK